MPTPFEWVTFGLGTAGTILGLVNGVRQIFASRIRLKVKTYPLTIRRTDHFFETVACVEVQNPGTFPVSVKEVAFELHAMPGGRYVDGNVRSIDGKCLPLRIEAHDAIQLCFPWRESYAEMPKHFARVVVQTACGHTRYGSLSNWPPPLRPSTPHHDSPPVI